MTRDALFEFGFREIELLEDISRARSRLGAAAADLLICAAEASDRGCSALFNDIRDGKIGDDVFLPIIATVREPKVDLIHDLVNGGVDLILTVPMSQAKLSRAVTTIIDIRKPFVVTSEYFGPDRREKSRARVSDVPLIRVPNSLRHKATGDDGGVDAQALANSVRNLRVEAYVNKVVITAGMISGVTEGHGKNGSDANLEVWIAELGDAANALRDNIRETRFRHQSALCDSLAEVAARLDGAALPPKKDLELVRQLALALQVAVRDQDETSATAALDITAIVSAQGSVG